MTTQQAQQNLQNLIDTCAIKGNIYGSAADCIAIQQSLAVLVQAIATAENKVDQLSNGLQKKQLEKT